MFHRSIVTAALAAVALLVMPVIGPHTVLAEECKAGESADACKTRQIAACAKNPDGFHIDWVMGCIERAKNPGAPEKMETRCTTYHTLLPVYKKTCLDPSNAGVEAQVTCKYLATHKKACSEQ